jgi:hypothetical protein
MKKSLLVLIGIILLSACDKIEPCEENNTFTISITNESSLDYYAMLSELHSFHLKAGETKEFTFPVREVVLLGAPEKNWNDDYTGIIYPLEESAYFIFEDAAPCDNMYYSIN